MESDMVSQKTLDKWGVHFEIAKENHTKTEQLDEFAKLHAHVQNVGSKQAIKDLRKLDWWKNATGTLRNHMYNVVRAMEVTPLNYLK